MLSLSMFLLYCSVLPCCMNRDAFVLNAFMFQTVDKAGFFELIKFPEPSTRRHQTHDSDREAFDPGRCPPQQQYRVSRSISPHLSNVPPSDQSRDHRRTHRRLVLAKMWTLIPVLNSPDSRVEMVTSTLCKMNRLFVVLWLLSIVMSDSNSGRVFLLRARSL